MKSGEERKKLVFVGLSGGVDSSVSAARLIDQGYQVVGVFIKVWQPEFLKCDAESDRLDAMRVAAHLKIPFLTLDAAKEYKEEVGDYFVNEYLAGRTPNPDVMCNRHVKFGAFWRFAKAHGADYIATGHYARTDGTKLLRGVDASKDQSYFLWQLTASDLEHVLFPIGDTTKEMVRAEARERGLPTAIKKDSQGICFLGHVDIKEFLSHFTDIAQGDVVDTKGQVIGEHDGALIYTLGQRHGFKIFGEAGREPHFVVGKDMGKNQVIVDTKVPVSDVRGGIELQQLSFVNKIGLPVEVEAQTRYRQTPFKAKLESGKLIFDGSVELPASGQSVVFYQNDECLGGGVVK